jgi:hypothetical protein
MLSELLVFEWGSTIEAREIGSFPLALESQGELFSIRYLLRHGFRSLDHKSQRWAALWGCFAYRVNGYYRHPWHVRGKADA